MKVHLQIMIAFVLMLKLASAQNSTVEDSLLLVLKKSTSDAQRAKIYNALSTELSTKKPDKSLEYGRKAYQLAIQLDNKEELISSYYSIGNCFDYLYEVDSALYYYTNYLQLAIELKDSTLISKGYNLVGSAFIYKGDYLKALENCFKSLKIAESINNERNVGTASNNIGNVFYFQNKKDIALSYWKKALDINLKIKDKKNASVILSNIGAYYNEMNDFKNAIIHLNQALTIQTELGNLHSVAQTLNNIGLAYSYESDYNEALKHFFKALKISEELKDVSGMIAQYNNIGDAYFYTKKYNEALKTFKTSDSLSVTHNSLDGRKSALLGIALSYEKLGDYKNAYNYHSLFYRVADSLLNTESTNQVAELETKYQTEKKEQENKLLTAQNKISEEKIKQQRVVTICIIIGLALVLLLAIYIFRSYQIKKKANKELNSKNELINKQKLEVEHQKELVEEKQKEILDSINYAKRIQFALLASETLLQNNLPEYFVLFKPKDVVSGDFYWASQTDDGFIYITADCTGHGVPGAFMSLLNISKLSEIINEKKIIKTDQILNNLRSEIIHALNPKGSNLESKDGMDAVLCKLNLAQMKLEYSAANNAFYIVRNNELIICKADKMPVGKSFDDDKLFTRNEIDLKKGDVIYTFTDGYADQFGGDKGKKFKYKQLEDILLLNNSLPMDEQKKILDVTIENWRKDLEQVDDILIIGVRV